MILVKEMLFFYPSIKLFKYVFNQKKSKINFFFFFPGTKIDFSLFFEQQQPTNISFKIQSYFFCIKVDSKNRVYKPTNRSFSFLFYNSRLLINPFCVPFFILYLFFFLSFSTFITTIIYYDSLTFFHCTYLNKLELIQI